MSATALWWITLGVGLVVVLVVAVLLELIVRSAGRIRDALVQVWVVGPLIAANTAQLDLLRRINRTAGEILGAAAKIAEGTERILEHADGCPGCPQCVIGWGGAGAGEGWRG